MKYPDIEIRLARPWDILMGLLLDADPAIERVTRYREQRLEVGDRMLWLYRANL